jgi:hypothetical protein
MNSNIPKLKTTGGVKTLFKKVKEFKNMPDGQEKLGLTLLIISVSKVLDEGYRKSLMEKVTKIFDRK